MIEQVHRKKNSDFLVEQIKEFITTHGLQSGDALPTEHALAEQFGVSRISVREATKTLGFLGLLEAKPGRGLTVGRVDVGRLKQTLGFHPALHQVPDDELIDSRVIVETGVMPHVARRMALMPEICYRLDQINDQWKQVQEVSQFIELDLRFHELLIESSGLTPLAAFNDLLQVFFRRFRNRVTKKEWKGAIKDHLRVVNALRDGNAALAAKILKRHIESYNILEC